MFYTKITMIEIKINEIQTPKPKYEVQEVPLVTESGKQFVLHVVTGFMNINEINRRAWQNPVLVTLPLQVKTEKGLYSSKEPVRMLFAHGGRDRNGKHVILGLEMESLELVQTVVKHLEESGEQRLKVVISCDAPVEGIKTRWDQGTLGNQLGVVGFSGAANIATTDAQSETVLVSADENIGPHAFRPGSISGWVVSDLFTFTPKDGRLVITPDQIK